MRLADRHRAARRLFALSDRCSCMYLPEMSAKTRRYADGHFDVACASCGLTIAFTAQQVDEEALARNVNDERGAIETSAPVDDLPPGVRLAVRRGETHAVRRLATEIRECRIVLTVRESAALLDLAADLVSDTLRTRRVAVRALNEIERISGKLDELSEQTETALRAIETVID